MKSRRLTRILGQLALATLASTICQSAMGFTSSPVFAELLAEADMTFTLPEGFAPAPVKANPVHGYEASILHTSGQLEVRYAIRPIGRVRVEYDDPHNAAPRPNDLFNMLFDALVNRLSAGGSAPTATYPPARASQLFNAGWAGAAVIDVDPRFASDYRHAIIVAMHRDDRADAYMILLFNDPERAREMTPAVLESLRFSGAVGQ